MSEQPSLGYVSEIPVDPEMPAVHEQLIVFARELGDLYRLERARSAELELVLASLQETYLATMKSLATVIEAKDQTTRGHLDRTQAYGLALARRVEARLAEDPTTGYGFFLHDIGKVGIPEHILCKAGPLSVDEWTVMRNHPIIGAQIVAPIGFLADAVELIRHHHERFDGTGYPDGLARLPGRAGGGGHPAGGPGVRGGGFVRRDDERPPVPRLDRHRARTGGDPGRCRHPVGSRDGPGLRADDRG